MFQDLWNDILEGKVDSEFEVKPTCSNAKAKFKFLFLNTTLSCFDASRQSSSLQNTHVMLKRSVNCINMFLQCMGEEVSFHMMFLKKLNPNYLQKKSFELL